MDVSSESSFTERKIKLQKMRILFLTNKVPYPPKDGGAIATLAMINSFARAGHETTVLAMNTMKHHITPFQIPEELTNQTIFHLVEVPAPISPQGAMFNFLFSSLPYNAERFIDRKYQKKLELLLKSHSYNVIQLEGLYLMPYIPIIRKFSKSLIVYRSHNIEHEIWERTAGNTVGLKKIYLKALTKRMVKFEKSAINQYDLLVPITIKDAAKLDEMGNKKPSHVVPAGIDMEPTVPMGTTVYKNLFFIGSLDWTPNQEGLLWFIDNCFPLVLDRFPDVRLKVAGRNAPEWFEKRLSHPNIDFIGEIDDAAIFIKQNGVMIVPLFSGSGMRVKIIEGMSHAKPIVTTSVGCEGIDAPNGSTLFIANTPEEFSKYVISLLSDKEKMVSMGQKASRFVYQHYNNTILIAQLAEFYQQYLK
jgi:glycosyltransferase involved in cell wall biosynthesis